MPIRIRAEAVRAYARTHGVSYEEATRRVTRMASKVSRKKNRSTKNVS